MPFDVEQGYAYACRLRGTPEDINPADWSIDWSDAPWPFKIYREGRRIRLGGVQPAWMPLDPLQPGDDIQFLGRLLFHAVGCTRSRHVAGGLVKSGPERPVALNREMTLSVRRAIASGGAMYPTEVYVVARALRDVPGGIYHYDPARHELTSLGRSVPDADLRAALQLSPQAPLPKAMLVVSDYFWKNFYKYGNFAYRLGAMDVGVALGRLQRLAMRESGSAVVHFDFDDNHWNEILGLHGSRESVYAVLELGPSSPGAADSSEVGHAPARDPRPVELQRSQRFKHSADQEAMHRSVLDIARHLGDGAEVDVVDTRRGLVFQGSTVPLPPASDAGLVELRDAILRRTSNGELFTGAALDATALATSLFQAHSVLASLRSSAFERDLSAPLVYCIVQRVAGIAAGSYRYEPVAHVLEPIQAGDFGRELQSALHVGNVNVDLSAFTIHLVDELDFRKSRRGTRVYRIQQMFTGAALDALMLASSAREIGCHPLLGFHAARIDQLYGLERSGRGTLAQVCMGPVRRGIYIEGSVVT
jgi:SagB-type dehydrogenase family enzyme